MPLDAHFVHKADDGRLAVLAVSFVEGPANPVLATLLACLPEQPSDPQTYPDVTIDPSGLLPSDMTVYRYMGSLTTPPCTEGVNWYVPRGMATASEEQIARLTTALGDERAPRSAPERPFARGSAEERLLRGPNRCSGGRAAEIGDDE